MSRFFLKAEKEGLLAALKRTNTENSKQIFPKKELRGHAVPISTFMCRWAIYLFPQSICLFCYRKYVDWSWEYRNCSQTHECGNWDWGRAIPRRGIHIWDLRCSACFPKCRCQHCHLVNRNRSGSSLCSRLVINCKRSPNHACCLNQATTRAIICRLQPLTTANPSHCIT